MQLFNLIFNLLLLFHIFLHRGRVLLVDELNVLVVDQFGLTDVDRLFHELAVGDVQNSIGVAFDVGIVRYLKRKFQYEEKVLDQIRFCAQKSWIRQYARTIIHTMTQVVLCLLLMSNNKSITSIVFFVSRSPVGSSNNNNSGSFAKARAMVLKIDQQTSWWYHPTPTKIDTCHQIWTNKFACDTCQVLL